MTSQAVAVASSSPAMCDEQRTRCEVWTRVMGYHRPVNSWNKGKQQEHKERKAFKGNYGND